MTRLTARKKPLVSVIVVNYNGKKYLRTCFRSLFRLSYPKDRLEIIMVDNFSSDDSIRYVERNYPKVKIVKNSLNNYSRANNLGIKQAKGAYIALLNNDTKVDRDWLAELIRVITQDDSVAAVMGKILFFDRKIQATSHYEFPNFYWSDRGFKEDDRGQYDEVEEVSSVSNCAVLYRKELFNDVGLLDEDFNMYMEDIDISIRARLKGWKLLYVPKGVVYHKFHGSGDRGSAEFYCEKNRLLLLAKHYPQKLAEGLFGKGNLTILNNNNELINMLRCIFDKLIKSHSAKTAVSILPDVFENLSKILNLEKDYLIQQLNLEKEQSRLLSKDIFHKETEISDLRQKIDQDKVIVSQKEEQLAQKEGLLNRQHEQLSQKEELLRHKDTEISDLKQKIDQGAAIISQKEEQLTQKDILLNGQHEQLSQKEELLCSKESEISGLKQKIDQGAVIISQKEGLLNRQHEQLSQKEELLRHKDTEISDLKQKIDQGAVIISQKEELLNRQHEQLSQKEEILHHKDTEISTLGHRIARIYNSRTYRLIARPAWKILDILKKIIPASRRRGLCLAYFSAQSRIARQREPNPYNLKITNDTQEEQPVKIQIKIRRNDNDYACFSKSLNAPPKASVEVIFDYDWQKAVIYRENGNTTAPDEFWSGHFDSSDIYSLSALLYDSTDVEIDRLDIFQKLEL